MVTKKEKKAKKFRSKYLTRKQAIKKLQIGLRNFRKLCILKGVHPRQPPHMGKSRRIYYFTKDINILQHDKILTAIRDKIAFRKKLGRFRARKTSAEVATLIKRKKKLPLDHLVKERYPTFLDALRDLDDPLTLISMFACIPPENFPKEKKIRTCIQLIREWKYYVAHTHSLRKAFVSVKGIYYQAIVNGITITWISPHQQNVNFRRQHRDTHVMLIFLKFYLVLMGFVNFKLFSGIGLSYPTFFNTIYQSFGFIHSLAGVITKPLIEKKATDYSNYKNTPDSKNGLSKEQEEQQKRAKSLDNIYKKVKIEPVDEELNMALKGEEDATLDEFQDLSQPEVKKEDGHKESIDLLATPPQERLFKGFYFFLGKETPIHSLEFVIKSMGGECSYLDGPYPEASDFITHQVVDAKIGHHFLSREYIQPQWVYDCLNVGVLLPIHEYAPGATLPPHLSPFAKIDPEGGYVPKRHFELLDLIQEHKEENQEEGEEESEVEEEEEDPDVLEHRYQKEMRAETQGKAYSEQLKKEEKKLLQQEREIEGNERKEELVRDSDEEDEEDRESADEKSESDDEDEPQKKRPKEEEERDLRHMMLSNTKRKRFNHIQGIINKKRNNAFYINRRAQELEKEKEKVEKQKIKQQKQVERNRKVLGGIVGRKGAIYAK